MARRTSDTDEFDELVGAAWLRLHRTAMLVTGDRDRADRLARSSLVGTWAQWPRARRDDPLAFAGSILVGESNLALLDAVDLTPDLDRLDVAPDPAALRELGQRRRDRRRLWAVLASVAGAAVVLAAVVVAASAPGSDAGPGPHLYHHVALTRYERKVLADVPGAYSVGGVVVVPGPIDASSARNALFLDPPVATGLTPLGTDLFTSAGQFQSFLTYPNFMNGPPPIDSQVVADVGPGALGCLPAGQRCTLALVADGPGRASFAVEMLDAVGFLQKDVELQVFIRTVYGDGRRRYLVVGGLGGTKATTVTFAMPDGSTRHAHVDRDHVSPGNTIFWGVVDGDVRQVTAYDRDDRVVNRHSVRSCDDPLSCRVR